MPNLKEEAILITNALFEDFGTGGYTDGPVPHVDGKGAILEMRRDGFPGWQEVEWPGYHVKYLVQKACEEKSLGRIRPYVQKKRHLVKGNYVWDTRFNANEEEEVILGDTQEYDDLIKQNGGIGILVVDAQANTDLDGSFLSWHEQQKGGSSDYSIEREMEGRPPRRRKTEYMIRKIRAYFFKLEHLRAGVKAGWLDDTFQIGMRNADGSPRNAKYKFKISEVPQKYMILVKNFNEDAKEFAEEFPEYT